MRIISIFIVFILASCSEQPDEPISYDTLQKQNSTDPTIIEPVITYYFDKTNHILLNDNDKAFIFKNKNTVEIQYDQKNKYIYLPNYQNFEGEIIINFEPISLVSTTHNNLNEFNIVSKYNFLASKNDYKINISKKIKEINIDNFSNEYEYNNLSNIHIKNHGAYKTIIVDLINKKNCSKNNGILLNVQSLNDTIIELTNENINNLICGKKNILIIKNSYIFNDSRNFALFNQKEIIEEKISMLNNTLGKKYPIYFYKEDNYIIAKTNGEIEDNNSLNYQYNDVDKVFTILLNKVPSEWLVVNKISLNSSLFFKLQNIKVVSDSFSDSSSNIAEKKDIDPLNIEKISFNNGREYSYLNKLSCEYFNNGSTINIDYFNKISKLILTKDNNNERCEYYSTQKMALNIFNFELSTTSINYKKNDNNYLNISRSGGEYKFEGKNGYKLYNYKEVNNKLYLYVDNELNSPYIIVNDALNTINSDEYNNIQFIDLSLDKKIQSILSKEFKVYRDYNESLQPNIGIFKDTNSKYYTIRSHSIKLNNDLIKCKNKKNIEIIKDSKYAYSFYLKGELSECPYVGIEFNLYKTIGDKIDIDFIKELTQKELQEVTKQHDKQQYLFNEEIKDSFIDMQYDVFYHNNKRFFLFKIKNPNKNSNLRHSIIITEQENHIIINIKEEKDFTKNKKQEYAIKTDNKINKITMKLTELDGSEKEINYTIN